MEINVILGYLLFSLISSIMFFIIPIICGIILSIFDKESKLSGSLLKDLPSTIGYIIGLAIYGYLIYLFDIWMWSLIVLAFVFILTAIFIKIF